MLERMRDVNDVLVREREREFVHDLFLYVYIFALNVACFCLMLCLYCNALLAVNCSAHLLSFCVS